MTSASAAFARQRLCLEFASLKHAAPEGVFLAPVPEEPLLWTGVMFVRKGPYANAILRFRLRFPPEFPARPPICALQTDVFHPLVTPLTTFTYSTRDTGTAATVSATDADRLPPGGLSLRHGFPEWFDGSTLEEASRRGVKAVEVLYYLKIVFDTDAVLDEAPLESAANSGAWHAWRSYRSLQSPQAALKGTSRASSPAGITSPAATGEGSGTSSPRQQPGGARRPGEWNWQGVWEDRVRKSIKNSLSEAVLFGGGEMEDVITFEKMESEIVRDAVPWVGQSADSSG